MTNLPETLLTDEELATILHYHDFPILGNEAYSNIKVGIKAQNAKTKRAIVEYLRELNVDEGGLECNSFYLDNFQWKAFRKWAEGE